MRHFILVLWLIGLSAAAAAGQTSGPSVSGGMAASKIEGHIAGVFESADGAFWFASVGQGVYRLSPDGGLVRFTTAHGLPADHARSIQQDRAGTILVSSDVEGVSRFDGRGFVKVTPIEPPKSEWKLGPDDLWFPAGQDTGSVYRWDGASLHRLVFPSTAAGDAHFKEVPRHLYPNAKYNPYDVYTIFKDGKGRVWFGTGNLGAVRYDGSRFVWAGTFENGSFGVRAIVEDKDGSIWLSNCISRFVEDANAPAGAAGEPLGFRKERGNATRESPYSMFVSSVRDKDGDLWVAVLGGGVYRYDGKSWTHYPVLHDGKPMWVMQLYFDRQGRLWLGTQGHGVYRLDGKAGKFERVRG